MKGEQCEPGTPYSLPPALHSKQGALSPANRQFFRCSHFYHRSQSSQSSVNFDFQTFAFLRFQHHFAALKVGRRGRGRGEETAAGAFRDASLKEEAVVTAFTVFLREERAVRARRFILPPIGLLQQSGSSQSSQSSILIFKLLNFCLPWVSTPCRNTKNGERGRGRRAKNQIGLRGSKVQTPSHT